MFTHLMGGHSLSGYSPDSCACSKRLQRNKIQYTKYKFNLSWYWSSSRVSLLYISSVGRWPRKPRRRLKSRDNVTGQ